MKWREPRRAYGQHEVSHMAMDRVEIITSVERRRRRSAAEKPRLVEAMDEPGAVFRGRRGNLIKLTWHDGDGATTQTSRPDPAHRARPSSEILPFGRDRD